MDRAEKVAWLRNKVCQYRNYAKQDRGWYIPVKPLEIEAIELQEIADELERLGRIEAEHQGCTENMASLVRERDEAERARDEILEDRESQLIQLYHRVADVERQRDEALVERDAAHQVLDELRRRATRRMVELRDTGIDMSGRPDAFCEGIRKSGRSLIGWLDELDPRKQEGKA